MDEVILKPIGFVKNNIREHRFGDFGDEISEIIVDQEFSAGLDSVQDYSHVVIVYLFDKVVSCALTHRPQGNLKVPVVGIYACRCPNRPNRIGISTVQLLDAGDNKIKVKGLDILDGTPVLDIKPYWPQYDEAKDAKVPAWVNELRF